MAGSGLEELDTNSDPGLRDGSDVLVHLSASGLFMRKGPTWRGKRLERPKCFTDTSQYSVIMSEQLLFVLQDVSLQNNCRLTKLLQTYVAFASTLPLIS